MSRKFIIIVVVALFLASAGAAFWYVSRDTTGGGSPAPEPNPIGTLPETPTKPEPLQPTPLPTPPPEIPATAPDPAEGVRMAAFAFAESYGSYSTDFPYDNLRRAEALATPAFRQQLEGVIEQALAGGPPQGFASMSTRALQAEVKNFSGGSAEVSVTVQRSQRLARTGELFVSYGHLALTLEQVNDSWLVASATWGE